LSAQGQGLIVAGRFTSFGAPIRGHFIASPLLTLFPILNFLTVFPTPTALPSPRTSWHDYASLTLGQAHEILVYAVV
jgi:hypothetical protein